MEKIRPTLAGLTLGTLLGGWHLLWVFLVALGWAQPLIDFIFHLHFIKPIYVIDEFNMSIAILLIVITTFTGYVLGWCFAVLWNRLYK